MVDATTDFGLIGPFVYMSILAFILYIGRLSLKKGIYGFFSYISVINISLWMIFSNPFAIAPFLIPFILFTGWGWRKSVKV